MSESVNVLCSKKKQEDANANVNASEPSEREARSAGRGAECGTSVALLLHTFFLKKEK